MHFPDSLDGIDEVVQGISWLRRVRDADRGPESQGIFPVLPTDQSLGYHTRGFE